MNKYFKNFIKTFKLKKASLALKKKKSFKHLMQSLRHFKNHSTKKIKKHFNSKKMFNFLEFKETEIIKTIKELPK